MIRDDASTELVLLFMRLGHDIYFCQDCLATMRVAFDLMLEKKELLTELRDLRQYKRNVESGAVGPAKTISEHLADLNEQLGYVSAPWQSTVNRAFDHFPLRPPDWADLSRIDGAPPGLGLAALSVIGDQIARRDRESAAITALDRWSDANLLPDWTLVSTHQSVDGITLRAKYLRTGYRLQMDDAIATASTLEEAQRELLRLTRAMPRASDALVPR